MHHRETSVDGDEEGVTPRQRMYANNPTGVGVEVEPGIDRSMEKIYLFTWAFVRMYFKLRSNCSFPLACKLLLAIFNFRTGSIEGRGEGKVRDDAFRNDESIAFPPIDRSTNPGPVRRPVAQRQSVP